MLGTQWQTVDMSPASLEEGFQRKNAWCLGTGIFVDNTVDGRGRFQEDTGYDATTTILPTLDKLIKSDMYKLEPLAEERMKMIAFLNQRQGKLLKEVDNG